MHLLWKAPLSSIQSEESVGIRIISKTTLLSSELCVIFLLTCNTWYPKISRCLFFIMASPFTCQEFLQNDLESRKSKAMLDRFRGSYYVCFLTCSRAQQSECRSHDAYRRAPGGSSVLSLSSDLDCQWTFPFSLICSWLGSLYGTGWRRRSRTSSKSDDKNTTVVMCLQKQQYCI